jgi:carbon storage regulator
MTMLVISRKEGERFIIDEDICIEVLEFKGGRIRFGITAPPEVKIYREELWSQKNGDKDHPTPRVLARPPRRRQGSK